MKSAPKQAPLLSSVSIMFNPTAFLQKCADNRMVAKAVVGINRLLAKLGPWHLKMEGQHVYFATLDRLVVILLHKMAPAEKGELDFFRGLCRPGYVVLDVGANLGVYALVAAALVGDQGRVVAVEASPDTHALLRKAVQRNGYQNLRLVNAAATDRSGPVSFFIREEHTGDGQLAAEGDHRCAVQVPGMTLDQVVGPDPRVDLIKLDIQGAEAMAIKGMDAILRANPTLKVISEFWPKGLERCGMDPRDYLAWWRGQGFKVYEISEDQGELLALPTDDQVMDRAQGERYINLFFSRGVDQAE